MFDGSICLIISNMEAITVDIKRHVSYKEIVVQRKSSKEAYVSSLPFMSIIQFLILRQGGIQTLVFKEQTMIWKERQG